jgi:glycosyltransferase involved in cell wall biosynthesis
LFNRENIQNANRGIRLAIDKRSEFIAVSNATRKDFLTCHPEVLPGRVHVIHEAADRRRFNPEICGKPSEVIRQKYGIPKHPFLLALSTIEPRKNLVSAIKAFLRMTRERPGLPLNFVVAGKMGWLNETVRHIADTQTDRLIFSGFIDDSDLAGLYAEAVALVYVSYCEGFGLPPLEAMCCGTPVIYGNNSAMIEVVDDGGVGVDPFDIEDIKEKYLALATNPQLRESLSKKAVARSRKFSWTSAATSTLAVYKSLALK